MSNTKIEHDTEEYVNTQDWINLPDLRERLGEDKALVTEMIQCFIDSAPELMMQIQHAFENEERLAFQTSLHAYKGVALNLSTHALAERLLFWEQHVKHYDLSGESQDWKQWAEALSEIKHCHEQTLSILKQIVSDETMPVR